MSDRFDWDALAPYWHIFEAAGSDDSVLTAAMAAGLDTPVLYIGGGVGTYAARLAALIGNVVAIDSSRAMVRETRVRHPEIAAIVADVVTLPFADAAFRSVVCATGVIEFLDDTLQAAYRELARVCRGGALYVAAFIDDSVGIDRHAQIAAWLAGQAVDERLDRLARELGDRERAARLLQRATPRYAPRLTERVVIDAAGTAGLSTRRLLDDRSRGVMLWQHA